MAMTIALAAGLCTGHAAPYTPDAMATRLDTMVDRDLANLRRSAAAEQSRISSQEREEIAHAADPNEAQQIRQERESEKADLQSIAILEANKLNVLKSQIFLLSMREDDYDLKKDVMRLRHGYIEYANSQVALAQRAADSSYVALVKSYTMAVAAQMQ